LARARKKDRFDTSTFEGRIRKQGYHIVGSHSAAKACKWARDAVLDKGWCYKHQFYGIASHRCLQSSPIMQFCNLSCRFCWRLIPETKTGWMKMPDAFEWDEPVFILDGLIDAQKRIFSGFLGNEKANPIHAKEAMDPKHATFSLIGEPTMYPKLSELLKACHIKGMTTFLVTNGTLPHALLKLDTLPTQLYVSLVAPDEKTYAYVTQQSEEQTKLLWSNYLKTLDIMASLKGKTRTTLRTTLAKELNAFSFEKYAELIKRAQADFVEIKSMVFVGGARNKERGLRLEDMLTMDEIREIGKKLASTTGYLYTDEHAPSRVALLCRDEKVQDTRYLRDISND
jgi:tRNA wybutosine-synthesizing protein 1